MHSLRLPHLIQTSFEGPASHLEALHPKTLNASFGTELVQLNPALTLPIPHPKNPVKRTAPSFVFFARPNQDTFSRRRYVRCRPGRGARIQESRAGGLGLQKPVYHANSDDEENDDIMMIVRVYNRDYSSDYDYGMSKVKDDVDNRIVQRWVAAVWTDMQRILILRKDFEKE